MTRSLLAGLVLSAIVLGAGGCPSEPPPDEVPPLTVTAGTTATAAVAEGTTVTLTATPGEAAGSSGVSYMWYQTYGRSVELAGADMVTATFVAPSLSSEQTLRFRVDAWGADGTIHSDEVEVVIAADAGFSPPSIEDDEGLTPLDRMRAELNKAASTRAQEFAGLVNTGKHTEGSLLLETNSELQYVRIVQGDGRKPDESDTVRVHYAGWLFDDGTTFDTSIDRGRASVFGLDGVIDGWTEGLQLMPVGSYYRFVIPPELAYGEDGKGDIPGDATLVFDVYLIAIE